MKTKISQEIQKIYGDSPHALKAIEQKISSCIERYRSIIPPQESKQAAFAQFDETSVVLIAYPDHIRGDGPSLQQLLQFLDEHLEGLISGVHILPFFPYSSDGGYSITDYRSIRSDFGGWSDIRAIAKNYHLMGDVVINHCSTEHAWFQGYCNGQEEYQQYFISTDPEQDLSLVARPRALPLLHPFQTAGGQKHVWTTFSADQVDVNFSHPEVLVEFIDLMLFYVSQGMNIIRLDAIAYLWKEIGTTCIHLPQTHAVVRLLRAVLDKAAPWVTLITECNVPYEDNISYFGKADEADLVYQFSLPPLLLDAAIREDTGHLQKWAAELPKPISDYGFLNFLASHDGIGLLPAHGILNDDEMQNLIAVVESRGGAVSYKATSSGTIPYELNCNYLSAICDPGDPPQLRAQKFMLTQSILLVIAGLPAIYLHSIIGSENWHPDASTLAALEAAGEKWEKRSVNREKLDYTELCNELQDPGSLRSLVLSHYKKLLAARRSSPALRPDAPQQILPSSPSVFAVLRGGEPGDENSLLCLHNFSHHPTEFHIHWTAVAFRDLIQGDAVPPYRQNGNCCFQLEPHAILWITADKKKKEA